MERTTAGVNATLLALKEKQQADPGAEENEHIFTKERRLNAALTLICGPQKTKQNQETNILKQKSGAEQSGTFPSLKVNKKKKEKE